MNEENKEIFGQDSLRFDDTVCFRVVSSGYDK